MLETTLKDIKKAYAIDITNYSNEQLYELRKHNLLTVAFSTGLYGLNGLLVIDWTTEQLYKVTARTNAIFILH